MTVPKFIESVNVARLPDDPKGHNADYVRGFESAKGLITGMWLASPECKAVEALPKTADGVYVGEGSKVYTIHGAEWHICIRTHYSFAHEPFTVEDDPCCRIDECYSTREAATSALTSALASAASGERGA
jgi:hypothetical protein